MKKSLLVLAVLGAFAGVASAQSSVTIYGTFDAGVRNLTNTDKDGHSKLSMNSSGTYNSNRLGFKGVEDLGDGMNAHFTLESGFFSGNGALSGDLFGRSAFVGLGNSKGSIDLGRQYTNAFFTIKPYDPFNYQYTGIVPLTGSATAGTRYNNDIKVTGNFGAITARAEYALGEIAGSTTTGSAKSVSASYGDSALYLGAAYTDRDVAGKGNKHYTVGGSYVVMPGMKAYVGYADEKQATTGVDFESKYSWIGASYAFTPALTATYGFYKTKLTGTSAQNGKRDLNIVGATYALSKRTSFYAALDMAKLDGSMRAPVVPATFTPAGNQTEQTGVSVGINHAF